MTRITAFAGLNAATYCRHAMHGEDSAWPEKNCYADVWIELVHTLGFEPRAMLPFTIAADFEGDQWTFFKPPATDLRVLYGIDVQEMTVWRPLVEHALEQLGAGKFISTEADAYWLPDTAGTDYRSKHTKTTIVLAELDLEARRLGYFHNGGYFELSGEDYVQLFRLDAVPDPAFLPLFAELVRVDRRVMRTEPELAVISCALLRRYAAWRPLDNPFLRFAARFEQDLGHLRTSGLDHYHAWAFASVRQVGAAFELAASHLAWLAGLGYPGLRLAVEPFEAISQANKALILKGARAVHTGKPLDAGSLVETMARAWDMGMARIDECLSSEDPVASTVDQHQGVHLGQ
jgi:hypothetical protein